ncbi:hypothetical protein [Streptomyces sp. B93]|uniref:hypothetical protein n=1 Tax=Streptomyces sp. B93 TaxID=2824875 RepID=UPI001B385521|nr:hypothetical protein [Streptomyces sp. B93]MBQ1088632.1 hypothetical protein [Streptomyces sp. B93]
MKIDLVLRELHRSENDLARHLLHVSDRHKTDHDVHHLARDLAAWSQRHVREIAGMSHRYGVDLDPEAHDEPALTEKLREKGSELIGRRGEAALLLLRDLRKVYTSASGVSADWEMLAQAAQAVKDTELLALCRRCHPDSLRQMRWANAKIKESAPQILAS